MAKKNLVFSVESNDVAELLDIPFGISEQQFDNFIGSLIRIFKIKHDLNSDFLALRRFNKTNQMLFMLVFRLINALIILYMRKKLVLIDGTQ